MIPRFDTGEPYSGSEIVAAVHRVHAAGEAFMESLPARVFVEPQGSKWSPADHVRHLTKSTRPVALGLALPKPMLGVLFGRKEGPSRSFEEIRLVYRARLEAGGQAGVFAPSSRPVAPDPESWRQTVLDGWREATLGMLARLVAWDEESLDLYRLPHPLLGRLTVREMLFFTLYHDAHHLVLVAGRIVSK